MESRRINSEAILKESKKSRLKSSNESTENDSLMVAPSANSAEGAFPNPGKAHALNQKITIVIFLSIPW